MNPKAASSLVSVLGIVLSLLVWQPAAHAQSRRRVLADSGVVSLGPNQVLRMTVVSRARTDFSLRFQRLLYEETTCDQAVCTQAIASRDLTDPVSLSPGEAVSIEVPRGSSGVRVLAYTFHDVLVSSFLVNGEIRDANTNQIIAILIGLVAPTRSQGGAPALFDVTEEPLG